MSNLDVALSHFWQFASHWKRGAKAKLQLSCEAGKLLLEFSAELGHPEDTHFPKTSVKKKSPSQLRRQERRRQEAAKKFPGCDKASIPEEADEATEVTDDRAVAAEESTDNAATKRAGKVATAEKALFLQFNCELCDFKGESETGMNIHMSRKHKLIPQIDGSVSLTNTKVLRSDDGDVSELDEDLEEAVDEGAPEEETEVRESLLPLKCGFCNFRAQTGGEVLIHSKKVHYSRKVH